MEKVVKTGLKFDLHIHSVVSAHKDGIKVKITLWKISEY